MSPIFDGAPITPEEYLKILNGALEVVAATAQGHFDNKILAGDKEVIDGVSDAFRLVAGTIAQAPPESEIHQLKAVFPNIKFRLMGLKEPNEEQGGLDKIIARVEDTIAAVEKFRPQSPETKKKTEE